jgi:integrase
MITTKIIFDRKKQAQKECHGTIEIRVIVDRRAYYISTGIRVQDREWKAERIVNRPDAPVLNQRLAIIYEKVCEETNRIIQAGEPFSVEAVKKKVWAAQEAESNDPLFLDWVEKQVDVLTVSYGTKKQYRTLISRLTEFDRIRKWGDVTAESICDFDSWLHQRKKKDGEKIIDSAVWKYHRCLKALINRAVTFGKIGRNPYDLLKGRFKRGDKENVEYLTESEMEAIKAVDVSGDRLLEISKDLFIMQAYTGLSYSDAQAFDFSQYRKIDGSWVNTAERIKTGVPYVSYLLPPAVEVLEKYDFKIPKIENHVYNRNLKALGLAAGIRTPLHSHLARHTFATWMLKNGAKIENVSKMLGHTNIRQTQRYAKVLAQSVRDEFKKVEMKMKK